MTELLNQSESESNLKIAAVQHSEDINQDIFKEVETGNNCQIELTETNDLFNLDSSDKYKLQIITLKLQKIGILDADETLEQWLLEMMPQITNGENLTLAELLAGLKQFLEL